MKKLFVLGVFSLGVVSLSACSTIQGVGKDITKASQATERAISK